MDRDDFPTGEDGPNPYQQVLGDVTYGDGVSSYQESRGLGNTSVPRNHGE